MKASNTFVTAIQDQASRVKSHAELRVIMTHAMLSLTKTLEEMPSYPNARYSFYCVAKLFRAYSAVYGTDSIDELDTIDNICVVRARFIAKLEELKNK